MGRLAIIQADARQIPLADETVQCVVTSPPYWGLRKYQGRQGAKPYGLEPTIEKYIETTVAVLREIRRVLRPDGVVFWNIGDSYCHGQPGGGSVFDNGRTDGRASYKADKARGREKVNTLSPGLKPKDLCLIPARVAIAAQADGWWVRSMIIWAKPNPMPESCTDRPTDAYEHILMLTKSERYFWDADAVREPSISGDARKPYAPGQVDARGNGHDRNGGSQRTTEGAGLNRNLRNVWTFPTQPYPGAHFATFPEEIPRRCILAATSERGACVHCGAPWQRIVEATGGTIGKSYIPHTADDERGKCRMPNDTRNQMLDGSYHRETVGWEPTCECATQGECDCHPRPCIVLDPFGGSGTTARVAVELNRRAVSLDLAYHDHAKERTRNVQRTLAAL